MSLSEECCPENPRRQPWRRYDRMRRRVPGRAGRTDWLWHMFCAAMLRTDAREQRAGRWVQLFRIAYHPLGLVPRLEPGHGGRWTQWERMGER